MTTRQQKTPRQRAEETLAVARRKVERLTVKQADARTALEEIELEVTEAKRRLAYVAADPALGTETELPFDETTTED